MYAHYLPFASWYHTRDKIFRQITQLLKASESIKYTTRSQSQLRYSLKQSKAVAAKVLELLLQDLQAILDIIFLTRIKMFDLSQSNYLVQPRAKEPHSTLLQSQACPILPINCTRPCNLPVDSCNTQTTKNDGKWSLRELMRYYLFLVQFKYLFKSRQLRKTNRVFSLMAKHIRSRKTSQCKSHHQKIQKNYGNIEEIIKYYKSVLDPLKQQWSQFLKTQKRVLINEYPEHNNGQDYYQILGFKNCLKIIIREECIRAYSL